MAASPPLPPSLPTRKQQSIILSQLGLILQSVVNGIPGHTHICARPFGKAYSNACKSFIKLNLMPNKAFCW
jgi:hypothetical protein